MTRKKSKEEKIEEGNAETLRNYEEVEENG
jgi:hypothetical protein